MDQYLDIPKDAEVLKDRFENLTHSLRLAPEGVCLEFGVYKGATTRHIAGEIYPRILYAFDSFKGLPEDWHFGERTHKRGHFDLKGKAPNLGRNTHPVIGLIQETLEPWMKHKLGNRKISFVHIDVDLYSTTKYILRAIKKNLMKGSIIVFDELADFQRLQTYTNWREGEYKALIEELNEFKIVSHSKTYAVTIQI